MKLQDIEKAFKDLKKAKQGIDNVLLEGVRQDDPTLLRQALAHGADPNARRYDWQNLPVLHEAALKGNASTIEILAGAGANPNAVNEFGNTVFDYINATRKHGASEAMTTALNRGVRNYASKRQKMPKGNTLSKGRKF